MNASVETPAAIHGSFPGRDAEGAATGASSRRNAASPMSRRRFFGSFSKHRPSSFRAFGGDLAKVRLIANHRHQCFGNVFTLERRSPVSNSYSTTPKAQISARLSTLLPLACSGAMYAAVPRMTPTSVAAMVSVGEFSALVCGSRGLVNAFANPKSSSLTAPSRRDLYIVRLQIAMNDALVVRIFQSGRRSVMAIFQASSNGSGPLGASPSTSSMASARSSKP